MPQTKHILKVVLVVDGAEYATEAEFEDRAGLMMMFKSLMVGVERGFVELMQQRQWQDYLGKYCIQNE